MRNLTWIVDNGTIYCFLPTAKTHDTDGTLRRLNAAMTVPLRISNVDSMDGLQQMLVDAFACGYRVGLTEGVQQGMVHIQDELKDLLGLNK